MGLNCAFHLSNRNPKTNYKAKATKTNYVLPSVICLSRIFFLSLNLPSLLYNNFISLLFFFCFPPFLNLLSLFSQNASSYTYSRALFHCAIWLSFFWSICGLGFCQFASYVKEPSLNKQCYIRHVFCTRIHVVSR